MSFFSEFKKELIKGQEEENNWIPLVHTKLNKNLVFGSNMYYIFGGLPGSGKTSIVDSTFVIEPFLWWYKNRDKTKVNPYWIYRSMERKVKHKIAKWTAYLLFVEHGIVLDVPTILNWPNKKRNLTEKELNLIASYEDFFNEMLERIIIISGSENPTGIYKFAQNFMLAKGEEIKIDKFNRMYIPNDPNLVVFHVTDHVGLVSSEAGFSNDKQILDRHSSYMMQLRDRYGVTPIDICQLNRNIEDVYRLNNTDVDVLPSDFAGSSDMYQNCDAAIGLMNPYKLKVFDYGGYKIRNFITEEGENRYRSLKILKNSFGKDDIVISFFFYGENGAMIQLPNAKNIDYEKVFKREYTKEFLKWRKEYDTSVRKVT